MRGAAIILMCILFLLSGCTSIPQQRAEAIALEFVENNVKFFARNESSAVGLEQFTIESLDSYKESGNWIIAMHVSSAKGNETKKADIMLKIDDSGNVVEFNGQKVKKE